jgi:hypothetical protein
MNKQLFTILATNEHFYPMEILIVITILDCYHLLVERFYNEWYLRVDEAVKRIEVMFGEVILIVIKITFNNLPLRIRHYITVNTFYFFQSPDIYALHVDVVRHILLVILAVLITHDVGLCCNQLFGADVVAQIQNWFVGTT